jgi:hypothetical protein
MCLTASPWPIGLSSSSPDPPAARSRGVNANPTKTVEKIHAQFDIWSKPGAGTEIDLRVPADTAYMRPPSARRRTWLWRGIFGHTPDGGAGD